MPFNFSQTPDLQASPHAGKAGSRRLARLQAVFAVVVLCTGLSYLGEAQALALGRLVVQSALGEPLKAEIDVPDINAEEAANLRVGLASSDAFRAAGMEFNPALASLEITLQRRANGTAYLRLTSTRPVSEPFVDMIIEASWATGRFVRDYTLLLDPPNLRASVPLPLQPGVTVQPTPQVSPILPRPVAQVAPANQAPSTDARAPAPAAVRTAPAPQQEPAVRQIQVRKGDTAGRIAAANLPANVSLDQMLVAMLRANPKAFITGNVNRIKAGAVIQLPDENEARNVAPGEARQIIAAQSRDFSEFRRRLAGTVPAATVAAADREATGKIQTEVKDSKPVATTQDKLTLSKGAAPGLEAAEEKIALERQAKEAASRVAELSKNIEELTQLGTSTTGVAPAVAGPTSSSSAPPATPLSVATAAPVGTPAETTDGPSAVPDQQTTSANPDIAVATETIAVAAAGSTAEVPATTPPALLPTEPSFMDALNENPLVLPAAGGLLVLLAGFALYRLRQRNKAVVVDSSFLGSHLQPDSLFGSSGGQRIDTAEAGVTGSSMMYSPSQLDAGGDVDPVAEADVYLAYGRDLQAEEILKEAMRNTPQRVAIHNKLLEIYAKRRDAKAYQVVATEMYGLTQGLGEEWDQACERGRQLDPGNGLYRPGGTPPVNRTAASTSVIGGGMDTIPFGLGTLAELGDSSTRNADTTLDLNLDLDLSMDASSLPLNIQRPTAPALSDRVDLNANEASTRAGDNKLSPPSMSMDFDLDSPSELNWASRTARPDASQSLASQGKAPHDAQHILPGSGLNPFDLSAQEADQTDDQILSFDMNDFSRNQLARNGDANLDDPSGEDHPLHTKYALAQEFRTIGDLEGARSLAEEVLTEATGALKTKARTLLAELN